MSTNVITQRSAAHSADCRWLAGLNHLSVSVRDVDEAMQFWSEIFEGQPVSVVPGKRPFHMRVGTTVLAFFEAPGLVGWDLEFPHYAFDVTAEQMVGLKSRLEEAGVTTHPIWTRNQREGLMYFRDPTGNLFELYCSDYCATRDDAELDAKKGGTFRPPVDALRYEWAPGQRPSATGAGRQWIEGLNHIALHVRDVDEAMQFWSDIFEGQPVKDAERNKRPFHMKVGGTVLAFFEAPGLVGWDLEYPHYGFTVEGDTMLALIKRLEEAGVRVHPIWTRNQREALMYFRDPSGNLFELYCPRFDGATDRSQVALGHKNGGQFRPPIADLRYAWHGRA